MQVSVREIRSYRVACMLHNGKYSDNAEAWERIRGWASRAGLLGRGPLIGLCYQVPVKGGKVRYEAGLAVAGDIDDDDVVEVRKTSSGLYAGVLHVGPYEGLPPLYEKVVDEVLAKNNLVQREGPFLEFFLNSAKEVEVEHLLVEICIPVEKLIDDEDLEADDLPPFEMDEDEESDDDSDEASEDDSDDDDDEEGPTDDELDEVEDEDEDGPRPPARQKATARKKTPERKGTPKKAAAKKTTGKKAAAKKAPAAKKAATKKKTTAKKAAAKKTPTKKK